MKFYFREITLNKFECMDRPPGQKKRGRCRDVALSGGSTVVIYLRLSIPCAFFRHEYTMTILP